MSSDLVGQALTVFTAEFGGTPEGVWSAPGRVNLIGEHTDYNDGFVMPVALAERTVIAVRRIPEPLISAVSAELGRIEVPLGSVGPGTPDGWGSYVVGPLWALAEAGHDPGAPGPTGRPGLPGLEITVSSNVPIGAGLSSSAALECAVLLAVNDLAGFALERSVLARLAQRGENVVAGAPVGIMDQSASLRCEAGHALFLDCRSLHVLQVPFDPAASGFALLLVDSRAPHALVDGQYAERRASCEAAARALGVPALRDIDSATFAERAHLLEPLLLKRARHIVSENERVLDTVALLRDGRLADIGPLLDASHASMRDDFEITVPQIDVAVEAARAAGAVGARMTGGGFGGCTVNLVRTDRVDAVKAGVEAAYSEHGFGPPAFLIVTPSQGARRDA